MERRRRKIVRDGGSILAKEKTDNYA